MSQRDYILRMIEQMGEILIELRRRILGGSASREEVQERLRVTAQGAGLDLEVARKASVETLELLVGPTGEVEPGRCWLLAETLYLDGLQAHMEERFDEACPVLDKARRLYALLEPGALFMDLPEAAERIAEIDGLLAPDYGTGGAIDREPRSGG